MQISKFKIMLLGVYITTVAIVVFLFFYYGVTSFLNPEYLMNNRDSIFSYIDRYIIIKIIKVINQQGA